MFAARTLRRHCLKTLSSLLHSNTSKNLMFLRDVSPNPIWSNVTSIPCRDNLLFSSHAPLNPFMVWSCSMSTSKGRSMRSKVERRMQRESGKTLREKRRAQKLKKKLMTEEERLIYNLKRAKKKVALLLQKLKKYELPELPPPRHDPELLTPEQLQAFKKVGFRNRNYVPVGVRGVFGGVVQNMHLHWKFHETVQVCCDNFPKEKIKEMATMLARLSGGIVINIHNTKTIIMFRGRNYRQPKNLIPINTLTKRKALFKARFEQALESQKLNIKKMEQQLRRMGVNPEDPVAMASIRKVASTFFNAIDRKEGSPYVFREEKQQVTVTPENWEEAEPPVDSDQEELDRFIAEIEDAADKEWVAEEAAEKEELSKIRYWNREEFGGRFRRSETPRANSYDDDDEVRGTRGWKETRVKPRTNDTDDEDIDNSDGEDEWDSNDVRDAVDVESDSDDSHQVHDKVRVSRANRWKEDKIYGAKNNGSSKRNPEANFRRERTEEESDSESMLSDLENATWQSDAEEEHDSEPSRAVSNNYRSSSDEEEDFYHIKGNEKKGDKDESGADKSYETRGRYNGSSVAQKKHNRTGEANNYERFQRKDAADFRGKTAEKESGSEDMLSDLENAMWESDVEDDPRAPTAERYSPGDEENHHQMEDEKYGADNKKKRTRKAADEAWDSD
ncbi:hypothetical protein I3843_04G028600 [Carya illinoinensis]|uniref:CRM-domain containing factor CFM9, mitochondrial n=1 Tax=Carya illinoinensis TaxID=32201 RepID=UPI001C72893C|nr:CRM-domain containing factor CFM9, mitochondrial [Carya illinoinensis]KAG7982022.1 hypothetical protein I3843_04G028600 [Carya illinoinensis]